MFQRTPNFSIPAYNRPADAQRLAEIAAVLIRHGLGDGVRRFGLADALEKAGHRLHWEHAADLARLAELCDHLPLALLVAAERAGRDARRPLGELIAQGKNNLQAPWLGITAFLSLSLLLTWLVFIGEGLRDAFDPRHAG